jgi:hypothetical protein
MKRRVLSLAIVALALAVGVLLGLHQGLSFTVLAVIAVGSLGILAPMTIVATPVVNNNNYKSWNITCQDADTTVTIAHGMGSSPPDAIWIQSALVNGGGTTTALVSAWGVTASGTGITLTKENLAGSGGATAGTSVVAKLYAWRPHSAAQ